MVLKILGFGAWSQTHAKQEACFGSSQRAESALSGWCLQPRRPNVALSRDVVTLWISKHKAGFVISKQPIPLWHCAFRFQMPRAFSIIEHRRQTNSHHCSGPPTSLAESQGKAAVVSSLLACINIRSFQVSPAACTLTSARSRTLSATNVEPAEASIPYLLPIVDPAFGLWITRLS